jgi:hypothetical protein
MKKALWIMLLMVLVQACSHEPKDLKSPCAGIDGSPCGPRRAVNDWWMKS